VRMPPHPIHIGVRYLRDNLRPLIERLNEGEHFVVLRHNHPVGALIPYADFLRLTDLAHGPAPVRPSG
jgi:antitoxin (DNA-binding transcriptional repressor) of toxin-antitoxin stability system